MIDFAPCGLAEPYIESSERSFVLREPLPKSGITSGYYSQLAGLWLGSGGFLDF